MGKYFEWNYTGETFHLFGLPHLITLAIVVLGAIGLIVFRKRFSERARRNWRYGMAALLIVNEIAGHIWYWAVGVWSIDFGLPLHMCSLFVWLTAIMLITRSYRVYEFAYFLGIGGAIQALITPNVGPFGFPHFRFFQAFFMHAPIVLGAVFMTAVEGYRPTGKSLLRVAVGTNLYMAAVFGVNMLLGSNYMFIAQKPPTASLMDYLAPWPWYILELEAIGVVLCLLLYLPFAITDWRKRRTLAQLAKDEPQ
jgi:hypothetical integral membrane protein (TIGR02206 family)